MPNTGNWGDGLINEGTQRFFSYFDIPFKTIRSLEDLRWPFIRDKLFVYGGGGAWCSYWRQGPDKVVRATKKFRRVIVMPSTYEGSYDIPGTTLYCRDRFQSLSNNRHAKFCHDMAFFINALESTDGNKNGNGIGHFFRTDKESAGEIDIPKSNIDLSLKGSHETVASGFFEQLLPYEIIETDRLHVAIAACLLGKKVKIYPGGYFKNEAVYHSTLKEFYPQCKFIGID